LRFVVSKAFAAGSVAILPVATMQETGLRWKSVAAAAAVAIVVASPAGAQLLAASPAPPPTAWPSSFYVGPEAGWTDLITVSNTTDSATQGPDKGLRAVSLEKFSAGFNAGGRAGYRWGPWRFEAEINYRHSDTLGLQMITPVNRPGRAAGAERYAVSEMVNGIYDFELGWPVTPHVGGGIGAAEVTRNLSNIFGGTNDTVAVFAYQAIAGIRYPINPALALDIDYRYFATSDTNFISTNPDLIKSNYSTHNVVVSLTWQFGGFPPR
jgi:opacity protein-like surface antigen